MRFLPSFLRVCVLFVSSLCVLSKSSIAQTTPDSLQISKDSTTISPPISPRPPIDSLNVLPQFGNDSSGSFISPGGEGDAALSDPNARMKDSLKASSDLQAKVEYKAADSIVFDVKTGMLYLYEDADLTYDKIKLKAKRVRIAMEEKTLYADGVKDEDGNLIGRPEFTQDEQTYQARTVAYNFKSQKGRVRDARMIQGEGFIHAETAKYHKDGSFHGKDGKYTTCNLEHPHYYIRSRKLKVLPNKKMVSGPLNLVIADFPIPIVIPFGFVPDMNSQGKKTGLLFPQYGEADDRGFFLRNLGYYFNISDYFDLKIDGDIYTRGGYRIGLGTNYRKKYAFSGNFALQYGVQTFNEKTDPDYRRSAAWSVRWSHSQPIDPTARFSSSVNISSSNSFQREISYNQSDFFTNNLSSSVSFSKNFNNLPLNFNVSARHQQDLNKETMSLELPQFNMNMSRLSPFKHVDNKNLKWLKQLGVNYGMEARNSVRTIGDSLLFPVLFSPNDTLDLWTVSASGDSSLERKRAGDYFSNGLRHKASAATTIKVLDVINISPSFNYNEFWYLSTIRKVYDDSLKKPVDQNVNGFTRGYDFTTSLSASTNFYGIYSLTRSKRQVAFRQRFTPSVSYNLKPDFSDPQWGFYEKVRRNEAGDTLTYSIFEDGIYRGPTIGESQAIGFSLSSVLEAKYRSKESFEEDFKGKDEFNRVNIIDNIGFSTSYNFAADSFQLSPFSIRARTSLFNRKVNLTASSTVDPYVYGYEEVPVPLDPGNARRLEKFMWLEEGKIGRLTRAQISLSTSFSSKQTGNREKGKDFDNEEFNHVAEFYHEYVDFTIPWSLKVRYNLSYSKPGLDKARITQTTNLSGDFNFAQSWKVGFTSGFDVQKKTFTQTSLNIHRLLHCWQMSFRWIPFGPQKSYSLVISANSSTLSMLRLSKNDFWQDRFR